MGPHELMPPSRPRLQAKGSLTPTLPIFERGSKDNEMIKIRLHGAPREQC